MNRKFLAISVFFNVVLLLIVSALSYKSVKNTILNKLVSFKQENVDSLALAMNRQVLSPDFLHYEYDGKNVVKIAFIGNSLTLHAVQEDVGWNHRSGMAASKVENDYVHKTVEKIAKGKRTSVDYAVLNIFDFERNFESFDYRRLEKINEFNPDYVVFQIGENVSKENIELKYDLFVEKYIELINSINANFSKILCIPFWYNKDKVQAVTKVAVSTKSFLVDLSHLGSGLDERNFAFSEVKYAHKGVGKHPGDYGMENISDNIYSVFNAVLVDK